MAYLKKLGKRVWRYVLFNLIALDQLGTTLVGGYPDETLSSYAWRLKQQGKPTGWTADAIDWLFLILFNQSDHCLKSHIQERYRAQMPPALREP